MVEILEALPIGLVWLRGDAVVLQNAVARDAVGRHHGEPARTEGEGDGDGDGDGDG
ncbi:hypothetical protein SAMN02799637_04675, partial [Ralstonia sp. UNCCL144]